MITQHSREMDREVLLVLSDQNRPTPEVARLTGEDGSSTYRRCRRLEKAHLLESTRVTGRTLLYCVDCDEVVTSDTYAICKDHDLRSFGGQVRLWGLTDLGQQTVTSEDVRVQ